MFSQGRVWCIDMFKYCKRCIGIRQFLGEPRQCDVCGAEW